MGKFLKYTRLVVEAVIALLLTLTLVYPTTLTLMLGEWVEKVQLFTLAMAFAVGWFALWIVVTLIFGRIYCSTVCPMAALQDLFGRLVRRRGGLRYREPNNALRYAALAVVCVLLFMGVSLIVVIADPCTAYSQMVLNLSAPRQASLLGVMMSLVAACAIAGVVAMRGRLICNTICPVGTTLGVVSRYSIFHIDIDTDLCTHCRKCEQVCKAECIDMADHVVDSSRCVNCFNCLTVCSDKAIRYTATRKQLSIPMMRRADNGALAASKNIGDVEVPNS